MGRAHQGGDWGTLPGAAWTPFSPMFGQKNGGQELKEGPGRRRHVEPEKDTLSTQAASR